MKLLRITIGLWVLLVSGTVGAEDLTDEDRNEIITQVIDQLTDHYVDPNLGQKAARTIKQKKEKQAYDALDTKASLVKALVTDMVAATHDKQLQLKKRSESGSDWIHPALTIQTPDGTEMDEQQKKAILQWINYGLPGAQVMEGNIGYLTILEFYPPEIVPEVVQVFDKAMRSFQACSAMILDLRQCSRGGDPEVMMVLASYFLGGEEPQPLYMSLDRENRKVAEFRTRTDIAGKRMPNIPLYILVSSETLSTGEMFAYGLQKVGRAKIVGETTAGAAHGMDTIDIGHGITMVLPVHRLSHVKTETNWQGTGVIPDVPIPADKALEVAKNLIRKK